RLLQKEKGRSASVCQLRARGSPSFLFSPSCRGNGAPTRRWPGSPGQRLTTSVCQGDFTVKTISLRENKYAARANSLSRLIQVGIGEPAEAHTLLAFARNSMQPLKGGCFKASHRLCCFGCCRNCPAH